MIVGTLGPWRSGPWHSKWTAGCGGFAPSLRWHMSVMRALCCGGGGGTARGLVDRGVFLSKVIAARWPGHRGRVPCRRCARVWFSGMSMCLVACLWYCVGMLGPAYEGAQGLGAWPVENCTC